MHVFAAVVLFGLAVTVVTMFAGRYLALARELWFLAAAGVGVGLAWLTDFDLWQAWADLPEVRQDWIGVTVTGLFFGGLGYFWHAVLEFFSGLYRKFHDEAETMEAEHREIRRVA